MYTTHKIYRMSLAFLLCVGLANAAEQVKDSTEFQVRTASGQVEKITVENLTVGEVRNTQSERGTSVVVGRHEDGYVLDIAGERIEVKAPKLEVLTDLHHLSADSAVHAQHKMVIQLDDQDQASAAAHQHAHRHKVVIVKQTDANGKTIQIEEGESANKLVHEMNLNDPELGDKRVMVIRKVEKRMHNDARQ